MGDKAVKKTSKKVRSNKKKNRGKKQRKSSTSSRKGGLNYHSRIKRNRDLSSNFIGSDVSERLPGGTEWAGRKATQNPWNTPRASSTPCVNHLLSRIKSENVADWFHFRRNWTFSSISLRNNWKRNLYHLTYPQRICI
jgi:hypothetical protein